MSKALKGYSLLFFLINQKFYPYIMTGICDAIRQSIKNIDEASSITDPHYVDYVIDEECDNIEDFLGIVFVACQTYITTIVSRVKELHKCFESNSPGEKLKVTDGSKKAIMALGGTHVNNSPYTKIEIIDALANYFKHKDEWHGRWEKLPHPSKKTASILQAIGLSQGSTGNFRKAAKILGNKSFDNLDVFVKILEQWRKLVYIKYKQEITIT